jgi:putative redox protein
VVQGRTGRIDRFERVIGVDGGIDPALGERLVDIANKCPVHRTLTEGAAVITKLG